MMVLWFPPNEETKFPQILAFSLKSTWLRNGSTDSTLGQKHSANKSDNFLNTNIVVVVSIY